MFKGQKPKKRTLRPPEAVKIAVHHCKLAIQLLLIASSLALLLPPPTPRPRSRSHWSLQPRRNTADQNKKRPSWARPQISARLVLCDCFFARTRASFYLFCSTAKTTHICLHEHLTLLLEPHQLFTFRHQQLQMWQAMQIRQCMKDGA